MMMITQFRQASLSLGTRRFRGLSDRRFVLVHHSRNWTMKISFIFRHIAAPQIIQDQIFRAKLIPIKFQNLKFELSYFMPDNYRISALLWTSPFSHNFWPQPGYFSVISLNQRMFLELGKLAMFARLNIIRVWMDRLTCHLEGNLKKFLLIGSVDWEKRKKRENYDSIAIYISYREFRQVV